MHACVDTTAPTASTSRSHADVADVNCTRYLVNLPIRNVSPINWIRPRCNRLHFHFNLGLPAIYQSWGCSNCSACPYQLFRSSKALLLRFYRLFPVCLGGLIWFIPRSFRIHLRSAKILSALALFPDFEASIFWFFKNIHHSFKNPQACLNKQRNFQSQRIRNNFEECSNQIKPADLFFWRKFRKTLETKSQSRNITLRRIMSWYSMLDHIICGVVSQTWQSESFGFKMIRVLISIQ